MCFFLNLIKNLLNFYSSSYGSPFHWTMSNNRVVICSFTWLTRPSCVVYTFSGTPGLNLAVSKHGQTICFPRETVSRGPLAYERRARYLDMTCTQPVAATRFLDSPRRSRRRNLFKNSWAVLSHCARALRPNVCEAVRSFSKTLLVKATKATQARFIWISLTRADRWTYWKTTELFTIRGPPALYKHIGYKRSFLNNYFHSFIHLRFYGFVRIKRVPIGVINVTLLEFSKEEQIRNLNVFDFSKNRRHLFSEIEENKIYFPNDSIDVGRDTRFVRSTGTMTRLS